MDDRCRIELLGEVRIVRGSHVVTRFRTRKTAHLLACLARSPGDIHRREELIDRFWPDLELDAGRDSLSTALCALRRALEPVGVRRGSVLIADRLSVRLNPDAVITDCCEFGELLDLAGQTSDPARRADLLGQAVRLCRGGLVPDCYDDWVVLDQGRWAERHVDTLLAWSTALAEAGDMDEALEAAGRAAVANPLREDTCAQRLRLYGGLGRYSEVRACYREYTQRLNDEIGDEPPASLLELVQTLRDRLQSTEGADDCPATGAGPSAPKSLRFPLASMVEPHFAPLPLVLTTFHGRRRELQRLTSVLAPAPEPADADGARAPRLVTITGPGGAGKTRLAVEVARRLSAEYRRRVAFVPLDSLDDPRRVPGTLLQALQLPNSPEADLVACLSASLGSEPVLLVLDNYEQLLAEDGQGDGRAVIRQLLSTMPTLRCLVTSRQALGVHGEFELRLSALSTPSGAGMDCESVALFVDQARSINPDFTLNAENSAEVAALCDKLEGLPLAIEMAAAWTRVLSARAVRERLERDWSDLTERRWDVPGRHRSLRATFEWSHELLGPRLRYAFAALSAFRGGWSLPAATAVCGEEMRDALAELAERSLLVVEEGGARYRYLEPVREFAAERLRERGDDEVRGRHARYYADLAEVTAAKAPGLDPAAWSHLRREYANLNGVLTWLLATGRSRELVALVATLEGFWVDEGHHLNDGVAWVHRALAISPARDQARARALRTAGWLALCQDRYGSARELYEEALAVAHELHDHCGVASALVALARVAAEIGDSGETRRVREECLPILRGVGDRSVLADGLLDLAGVMLRIGDQHDAECLLEESAFHMRALGRLPGLSRTLYSLASLSRGRGDNEKARVLWAECVVLDESIGIKGGGALWGLGMLAEERCDRAESLRWYRRSLSENLESSDHRSAAEGLLSLAEAMLARDAPDRAARVLGSSLLLQSLTDQRFWSRRRKQAQHLASDLRERLGAERCEALLQEGWRLPYEAMIDGALRDLSSTPAPVDTKSL
jgi:predicted ATPase/DNA-binding SARP family transcriptional activator